MENFYNNRSDADIHLTPERSSVSPKKCIQSGFTLIELMIVVGIVGILVSLASVQYQRYQRKALQSEAKLALGSMYALEKSFYGEYAAYIPAFDAIGYAIEGAYTNYYHTACYTDTWAGTVTGYTGSSSVREYARSQPKWAFTSSIYSTGSDCAAHHMNCSAYGNDPQAITMYASGQLCSGCLIRDEWYITESKVLANCSTGL